MSFDKKKVIAQKRAELEKNINIVYWNWMSTEEKAVTGSGDEEGVIEYRFLINNQEPRTVQRILDGIAGYLENAHTKDRLFHGICKGKDKKNYHYMLIKFTSTMGPTELTKSPGKIYAGRVARDKRLTDYRTDESLVMYSKGKLEDLLGVKLP